MKKKKYEGTKGLRGRGVDYSLYRLKPAEFLTGAVLGVATGFVVGMVFFESALCGVLAGFPGIFISVPAYRKYLKKRRMKYLLIQFRDFLESLSNSLSAGQNISMAISSAYNDMVMQYGEKSLMAAETKNVLNGMRNNNTAENMFMDFAERSGQDDIQSFAETFQICNRTGGNIKNIISETYRIIREKMTMEKEIAAIASGGKNELIIMTCMPLIIVPMLRTLGDSDISGNNGVTIIVRVIGIIIIGSAYAIGCKIAEIT